jgi:hypothetical protein
VGLPPQYYPTHSNGFHTCVTGGSFTEVSCLAMPGLLPDGSPSYNRYNNPFATTSETPHQHYLYDPDGDGDIDAYDFDLASADGDAYDEACRLKRVNGVFQVFKDWNLAGILAMP